MTKLSSPPKKAFKLSTLSLVVGLLLGSPAFANVTVDKKDLGTLDLNNKKVGFAHDVSADGSVVVGMSDSNDKRGQITSSDTANIDRATVWTGDNYSNKQELKHAISAGSVGLFGNPVKPDNYTPYLKAVSDDGKIIAGARTPILIKSVKHPRDFTFGVFCFVVLKLYMVFVYWVKIC